MAICMRHMNSVSSLLHAATGMPSFHQRVPLILLSQLRTLFDRLRQLRALLLCHTSPASYSLHACKPCLSLRRPDTRRTQQPMQASRHWCRHHPGNTFAPHTPHDTSPMPSSRMVYCASACDQIPNVTAIMKRAFVHACACAGVHVCCPPLSHAGLYLWQVRTVVDFHDTGLAFPLLEVQARG